MTPHWELIPVVAKTVVLCSLWFGALDKKLEDRTAQAHDTTLLPAVNTVQP